MNKGELSIEYSRIYKEANEIFKKYNPCQFKDGECSSDRHWRTNGYRVRNGCCGGCRHIGPNGCKVKSLGCKLFTCEAITKKHKKFKTEIERLRVLARKTFRHMRMPPIYMTKSYFFSKYYYSRKEV